MTAAVRGLKAAATPGRRDEQGRGIDIDEHRRRADRDHGRGGRDEGVGGNDDLVTRPDIQGCQGQLERSGTAGDTDAMLSMAVSGPLGLEALDEFAANELGRLGHLPPGIVELRGDLSVHGV